MKRKKKVDVRAEHFRDSLENKRRARGIKTDEEYADLIGMPVATFRRRKKDPGTICFAEAVRMAIPLGMTATEFADMYK